MSVRNGAQAPSTQASQASQVGHRWGLLPLMAALLALFTLLSLTTQANATVTDTRDTSAPAVTTTTAAPSTPGDEAGAATSSTKISTSQVADLVKKFEAASPGFTGHATSTMPARLNDAFKIGGVTIKLGTSATGTRHAGFVDYGTTSRHLRVVAATDGTGTQRFGVVLDPRTHTQGVKVPVVLPKSSTVINKANGQVVINHPGNKTGNKTVLAPALAVDATGKSISASYRIIGHHLVIKADLTNATGPVLVDPSASYCYWWGCDTFYSIGEVRWSASAYGYLGVASAACRYMGPLAGVCRNVVGRYTSWIADTWNAAKNNNQCLKMSMTWTGQVTGVSRYNCGWW